MNNNEELTKNEMTFLLMGKIDETYQKYQYEISRIDATLIDFASKHQELTLEMRGGFEYLHERFETLRSDFVSTEKRLSKKIDFYHEKTNKRIDRLETKVEELA